MKKSINYLPESLRHDLRRLVELYRKKIAEIKMIILYDHRVAEAFLGGEPPPADETPDFYGVVLVTRRRLTKRRWDVVARINDQFFLENGDSVSAARPVYLNIPLFQMNRELKAGYLFCSLLKKVGVLLYDNTGGKLARRRKFDFRKIEDDVQRYYAQMLPVAEEFLWCAEHCHAEGNSRAALFLLHQVVENYLHTVFFVLIQYWVKLHDFDTWYRYCRLQIPELAAIFPHDTEEEIRLYELLQNAYINARYEKEYCVDREDIDTLVQRVHALRALTMQVCRRRFELYERLVPPKKVR